MYNKLQEKQLNVLEEAMSNSVFYRVMRKFASWGMTTLETMKLLPSFTGDDAEFKNDIVYQNLTNLGNYLPHCPSKSVAAQSG